MIKVESHSGCKDFRLTSLEGNSDITHLVVFLEFRCCFISVKQHDLTLFLAFVSVSVPQQQGQIGAVGKRVDAKTLPLVTRKGYD